MVTECSKASSQSLSRRLSSVGNETSAVWMFGGQGSQRIGMGLDLVNSNAVCSALLGRAESRTGLPLRNLIDRGPMADLTRTDVLQPALCAVQAICVEAARTKDLPEPVAVMGHSLGLLTAGWASGALSFDLLIDLAWVRGKAMASAAATTLGTMLSLKGNDESIETLLSGAPDCYPACRNAPDELAVAGPPEAIERLANSARMAGVHVTRLSVAGAWHTPALKSAAQRLRDVLAGERISTPRCPIFSGGESVPILTADDLSERFVSEVFKPLNWVRTLAAVTSEYPEAPLVEFGPGKVLAGLAIRSHKRSTTLGIRDANTLHRALTSLRTDV